MKSHRTPAASATWYLPHGPPHLKQQEPVCVHAQPQSADTQMLPDQKHPLAGATVLRPPATIR